MVRWAAVEWAQGRLLVCVDRLMGQTHELADGWRRTSPVGLPHMSSVSVQGLAVRSAGGDRCATVAINCLPSEPGKVFLAASLVVCHGRRRQAFPSQALHHDVLPSCSVASRAYSLTLDLPHPSESLPGVANYLRQPILAVIGWIASNPKEPCPCPLADAAVATITSTPYYRPRACLP